MSLNTPHEAVQAFLAYLLHILRGRSLLLESAPGCGRVRDPANVECIWDCDWVSNPWYGQVPQTGTNLDLAIAATGLRYSVLRYPRDITCLQDCSFLHRLQTTPDLLALLNTTITQRSNIDSLIIEACLVYFQLGSSPDCLSLATRGHRRGGRLTGNSISNSYPPLYEGLEHTLHQYPWACSLRTQGWGA